MCMCVCACACVCVCMCVYPCACVCACVRVDRGMGVGVCARSPVTCACPGFPRLHVLLLRYLQLPIDGRQLPVVSRRMSARMGEGPLSMKIWACVHVLGLPATCACPVSPAPPCPFALPALRRWTRVAGHRVFSQHARACRRAYARALPHPNPRRRTGDMNSRETCKTLITRSGYKLWARMLYNTCGCRPFRPPALASSPPSSPSGPRAPSCAQAEGSSPLAAPALSSPCPPSPEQVSLRVEVGVFPFLSAHVRAIVLTRTMGICMRRVPLDQVFARTFLTVACTQP